MKNTGDTASRKVVKYYIYKKKVFKTTSQWTL